MTILVADEVLDTILDDIITKGNKVHLLTTFSTSYATVVGANSIGSYSPTITKGDNPNTGLGRRGIIAAATGVVIGSGGGTFTHYAVVDTTNSKILAIGEGTNKPLTDGDTVATPEFYINVLDGVVAP